ncbi:MAG: FRG domain-containing protein [Erysipelotrichaceae bacterium]|nr:FRG domain-containing protein [Erysipelotrichaceae bacterium]MDD3923665.1 FRG domain-containing protein [Erysipelotrichaceae bacterium]MDD4642184.1 FRG domain-containing protein [Erysipelotrichaceae bacterium]
MREYVVRNWDQLQAIIFRDVWQDDIKRYRANFIYRGVGDISYELLPKLNRVCNHNLELEDSLLRNFKKYAYADIADYQSFWQILTLAQHHGLPTRLLDWSYSPLVAAHFATEEIENYDKDGLIWCVDYEAIMQQLPSTLKDNLNETNSKLFSLDMLEKVAQNFDDLKKYSDKPYVIFFEPSSIHNRIINQYALFSVLSDSSTHLSDILDVYKQFCFKIIIPKEIKLEIRDKLDYINISERMIYPGLDGICKWITRKFSDLGPKYNTLK